MKQSIAWCVGILLGSTQWAGAAPGTSPQDLQKVQKAISSTQQQIRHTTTTQKQVDASLARTQTQLRQAQTQLATLARQHHLTAAKLQQLQSQLEGLKTQIGGAQTQVARLLNAHYRNRQPNAINLWLNNTDTQQKGRLLQYMRYVNLANEHVITRLRQQQQALATQQQAIHQQQKQLARLQTQQQNTLKHLGRQQDAQQNQSTQLDGQLTQQTAQLQALKANERQLSSLINRLSAQAAAKRKAARPTSRPTPQAHPRPQPGTAGQPTASASTLTAEDLALQAPNDAAVATVEPNAFARRQGQMGHPVGGHIAGRFGQSRPGGGSWKGLFFATPPTSVHSIAPGEVMYAGALAGYGNTVIVDHGSGYVSVYTGLSGVSVHTGSHVAARQALGRSGALPDGESGLYFEIRYHSQPMNPLSFIS